MKVIWSNRAEIEFKETLKYWVIHNQSATYSEKIYKETEKTIQEIEENPYFLAQYVEKLNIYRKIFFKGKFSVFYEIKADEIYILRFRSNTQKPLHL